MSTLVVLGAGDLGGAAVRRAVTLAVARRVVLVDDAGDVARGKALDILQSAAIDGVAVDVAGTNDLGAVVGAAAIVLADRHGPPTAEHQGDAAARLLVQVRALNRRALVVCAGATQLDVVERLVHEHGANPALIVGSAPEALRLGVVALTSLAAGAAPRDVSLTLVGRPPRQTVVPWSDAAIAGRPATGVLDPPALLRLDAQLPHLWPPGPLALGCAAVRVVQLALTNALDLASLFVVPPGAEGVRARGVTLPATVRVEGVTPRWPRLSPRDRTRFESALAGIAGAV